MPERPEDVAGWRWPELFLVLFLVASVFIGADAIGGWPEERRWIGWMWWAAGTALGAAVGIRYGLRSSLRRRDARRKQLDMALAILAAVLARPLFAILDGLDAAAIFASLAGFLAVVPLVHMARVIRALGG